VGAVSLCTFGLQVGQMYTLLWRAVWWRLFQCCGQIRSVQYYLIFFGCCESIESTWIQQLAWPKPLSSDKLHVSLSIALIIAPSTSLTQSFSFPVLKMCHPGDIGDVEDYIFLGLSLAHFHMELLCYPTPPYYTVL